MNHDLQLTSHSRSDEMRGERKCGIEDAALSIVFCISNCNYSGVVRSTELEGVFRWLHT